MALGGLESGHGGFIQDASGGIALYLDSPVSGAWPARMTITVEGALSSRYAQRTLRISETSLVAGPAADLPGAHALSTGSAGESDEGRRVSIAGTITGAPDQLADGLAVTLDDGSGPVRAILGADAVAGRAVASGMVASVAGPLGQRDSSGTGAAGYRVHATILGELELMTPTPSPTPTPAPTPTPNPTSTPTAGPTSGPTPTPPATPSSIPTPPQTATPQPTASPLSLGSVRTLPLGTRVATTGVVVAEAGRLGTPALIAIGDASAGLVVRGPSGAGTIARGTLLEVAGKLAAPYGQLEIRPTEADVRIIGTGPLPSPTTVGAAGLTEADEGRLVTTTGRLEMKPTRTAAGDITIVLVPDGGAPVKVMADVSSGITVGSLQVGATYRIVGFVGQRATRSGALDGYRIWVRDAADLVVVGTPGASVGPSSSPAPSGGAAAVATMTISRALLITDRAIAIEAVVTAPAALFDASGRRIVVQDGSGAVEVLLPTGSTAPTVGTRIRAEGRMGVAYGAPRLRAERIDVMGSASSPAALVLHGLPGEAHEWRLVTISGRVMSVHKLGDRWRAEIRIGAHDAVVVGQPGAGIASTVLVEGRVASVTGIVRRPYPNASDRRFAVTPRTPADVSVAGRAGVGSDDESGSSPAASAGASGGDPSVPDADLVDLAAFVGRTVRVGGLVVDLHADGFTLDDGTAVGRVVLRSAAIDALALVEPDDALNVIGRVESTDDGPVVVVDDPGRVILAGDPVAQASPAEASPATAGVAPSIPADGTGRFAGLGGGPLPLDAGAAGLGTLLAISAASLAVTVLRREHARRRLAARIAGRLATFAGPSEAPTASTSPERGPSTSHSA